MEGQVEDHFQVFDSPGRSGSHVKDVQDEEPQDGELINASRNQGGPRAEGGFEQAKLPRVRRRLLTENPRSQKLTEGGRRRKKGAQSHGAEPRTDEKLPLHPPLAGTRCRKRREERCRLLLDGPRCRRGGVCRDSTQSPASGSPKPPVVCLQ